MHAASIHIALLLFSQIGSNPFDAPRALPAGAVDAQPIEFAPPTNSVPRPSSVSNVGNAEPQPASPDFTPRFIAPPTPIDALEAKPIEAALSDELESTKSILRNVINAADSSKVAPAAATQPIVAFSDDVNPALSKRLLARALTATDQNQLRGSRITILDALRSTDTRATQLAVIKAYWRLSLIMSDQNHAAAEVELISNISKPQNTFEQSLWGSAVTSALARHQEATLAAVASQHDLAGLATRTESDSLPLPADSPFVGPYQTKFDVLFSNRAAPKELRKLDAILPHYLNLVYARAAAIDSSEQALHAAIEAYETGQISIPLVIEMFEKLRDQRIAFLATVRDYNVAIADYALNVARPSISREEIVSMLIVAPPTSESASTTQPAARTARNERSVIRSTQPPSLSPIEADAIPANVVPVRPAPGPASSNAPSTVAPSLAPIVAPAGQFVPRKPNAVRSDFQPSPSLDLDRP